MDHPYLVKARAMQRYERMRHQADVWRFFHRESKHRSRGPHRQIRWLLRALGQVLVRLGRRLAAYGAAQTALGARE